MNVGLHEEVVSSAIGWTRTWDQNGAETGFHKSSFTRFGAGGARLEKTEFGPTGSVEKKKVFDDQGRLSEDVSYNADGSINFTNVYRYDERGSELQVSMYLGGERYHGRWASTLDSGGRVMERVWYDKDEKQSVSESIQYDARGRIERRLRGNVAEWTYRYDDSGRLVRVAGGYYSSDEPDDIDIEYNEEGRVRSKTRYFSTGAVRSVTTYEYG